MARFGTCDFSSRPASSVSVAVLVGGAAVSAAACGWAVLSVLLVFFLVGRPIVLSGGKSPGLSFSRLSLILFGAGCGVFLVSGRVFELDAFYEFVNYEIN